MKFKLQAGAEADLLSPAEAKEIVTDALRHVRDKGVDEPVRPEEGGQTDANGNLVIPVYVVPLGKEFVLTRLLIDADGFTPAAPFKNAAGWIDVLRSGERVDFINLINGIPALSVDSKQTGNRFRNGERVEVAINGGPVSSSMRARAQGFLHTPSPDLQPARTRQAPTALAEPGQ